MRERRAIVTPDVTPAMLEEALDPINNPSQYLSPEIDADGNVIPGYD